MKKKSIYVISLMVIIISASIIGILFFILLNEEQSYFLIEIYNPDKTFTGTTLFADLSNGEEPRIVEVDMDGNVVWEYILPDDIKSYTNPGFDVELLPSNNVLFLAPQKGIYEINRAGIIVWSYLDDKASHDADRLPNGNTIFIWGGSDTHDDLQVKEVNTAGTIIWSWKAKDHYYYDPYKNISMQGWTHSNAVTRFQNGNTAINLRNFNLTVIVNNAGKVLKELNWSSLGDDPHEPEFHPNGNIVIALQWTAPNQVVEIKNTTSNVVWTYHRDNLTFARDADRLANNNTLIVGVVGNSPKIFEVTSDGEIVWQLAIRGKYLSTLSPGWFYKAERIYYP